MPSPTETILIVDDDKNDVDLMRHAFIKAGYKNPVHVCLDGDCALAYLDGTGSFGDRTQFPLPFLVILDWKLLGSSGLEVLKAIRTRQRTRELCVVVLSGSEYEKHREAALKAGADLYLEKPTGTFEDVAKAIVAFWDHCETPD